MHSKFLLLIISIFSFFTINAQQSHICGLESHDEDQLVKRLLANKAILLENPNIILVEDTYYLPITYHLTAKSDGSDRIRVDEVLEMHCELNELAANSTDFQFYILNINNLDNDEFYLCIADAIDDLAMQNELLSMNDIHSINVYTSEKVGFSSLIDGYFFDAGNAIFMKKNKVPNGEDILAHEIGHFFSLLHPFYGWYPYLESVDGNPVTSIYGSDTETNVLVEHVNGDNCETAGDFICDTPANYNLVIPNCMYQEGIYDINGDLLAPDKYNIMDYFGACDDRYFSPMQVELMKVDYLGTQHDNLRAVDFNGSTSEVTSAPILISGHASEVFEFQNNILLSWEDVTNADKYLVEITGAFNSGFIETLGVDRYVVNSNSATINDLDPGLNYIWRVTPFGAINSCLVHTSELGAFTTGNGITSTKELKRNIDFSINPNVLSSTDDVQLQLMMDQSGSIDLAIFDIRGASIITQSRFVKEGENNISLPTLSLEKGVYWVKVFTKSKTGTKRIVVQ